MEVKKCHCVALEDLINCIKEVAPLLSTTENYLRKRPREGKDCPGAIAFKKYKKKMDKSLKKAIAEYGRLKAEGHEQD